MTYVGNPRRTKYSSQPIRPSGVVSQVLPVRQQPWISTIEVPLAVAGTWKRVYIWSTVIVPAAA